MVTRRDYILSRKYKLRLKFEKEPALCEEQGGRVLKVERATCAKGSEAVEFGMSRSQTQTSEIRVQ